MISSIPQMAHGPGLDSNPKGFVIARAAAARTRGDLIAFSTTANGLVDAALPGGAAVRYVGVAAEDIASGERGTYQVSGRCDYLTSPSLSIAAGDGLGITTGAIVDSAATADVINGVTTNTHFAVQLTATTTATVQDVYLYGQPVTST